MGAASAQTKNFLLLGTYTSGKSEGIYVYSFDTATADFQLMSTAKISNPSYLAVSPDEKTVYAVAEDAETTRYGVGGSVNAFSFNNSNGTLTPLNQQFSGGKHPCYVAVDKTGSWLFVGNYSSGNLALFPLKADGSIDSVKQVMQDAGSSVNKDRQEGPHVHATVIAPGNDYLFTPDLGTDKIMIYHFDAANGSLSPAMPPFTAVQPGGGPRHFDFAPNQKYAYLVEELSGMVAAYKYKNGKLKLIERVDAHPADFKGTRGSADIHVSPDGQYVYCSNRGDANSITIFKINRKNGKLTVVGHQSTLGKTPRNFNFDPSGNFLLVANQQTDDVIIFKIDHSTGLLTNTGKKIAVPSPICIKWIK